MWARCWLQRHLNSQQAACHSHKTGKSLGSFHSAHRCPIFQTKFGSITVLYELLGCFFFPAASDWCLHFFCWTFSLHVTFPWECGCRAQCSPFSLTMNQHSHQVHLACLSSSYPCTWALLGPWLALPAGERQCLSNIWSKCARAFMPIPALNPCCQQAFPLRTFCGLPGDMTEKVHKIVVLAVIIMGLCGITGDWSFSSDRDNCCAEWMWEKSLLNCVHLPSISQPFLCAQKDVTLQLVSREQLISSLCGSSHQIPSFALYHLP